MIAGGTEAAICKLGLLGLQQQEHFQPHLMRAKKPLDLGIKIETGL